MMVWVPELAREPTVSLRVDVPVPVMDEGLKLAVTLLGRPLADKVTAELNPPETVLLIVEVPELPLDTVTEVGEALRVKLALAGAVTVRLTVAVCEMVPFGPEPEPVTVIVDVPVAAVEATVMVMVEVPPEVVMDVGLKPTVTPEGWPAAVKPTAELKPFTKVTVIVEVPALP